MNIKKSNDIKNEKYGKFKKPLNNVYFDKTLSIYIICDKCGSKVEKIFKDKELKAIKFLEGTTTSLFS